MYAPMTGAVVLEDVPLMLSSRGGDSVAPLLFYTDDHPEHPTIVQFSCAILYGDMEEGEIMIDIVRHGYSEGACRVKYETVDVSALAGETYVPSSGEACFEPGQHTCRVAVPFIVSTVFHATLEFQVLLSQPQGCTLGTYLHTCRVKVIDANCFPSNRFRDQVRSKAIQSIPPVQLFATYVWWNLRSAKLLWPLLLTVLIDQLSNVYVILLIAADMYLVNIVMQDSPETASQLLMPTREETAYLIAAANVLPYGLLHLTNLLKVRLGVEEKSISHLQKSIFRKYMNLTEESMEEVGPGFHFTLMEEAPKVASGFIGLISMFSVLVDTAFSILLVLRKNVAAAPLVMCLPVSISLWAVMRHHLHAIPTFKLEHTQVSAHALETTLKMDLIRAFFLRPRMNQGFVRRLEEFTAKVHARKVFFENTNFMATWLPKIFWGLFLCIQTPAVLSGELRLGTFLGTLAIIRKVGVETVEAGDHFIEIYHTIAALRSVTTFMNKDTDLRYWRDINQQRRMSTLASFGLVDMDRGEELQMADSIDDCHPLIVTSLGYSFRDGTKLLHGVNMQVTQGTMNAVCGPYRSGKSTLMRLLAMQTVPKEGKVSIPSHLRVLLVRRDVQFLDRSLYENLTVGCQSCGGIYGQVDLPRLKEVLEQLSLGKLIPVIDEELRGREAGGDGAAGGGAAEGSGAVERCATAASATRESQSWLKQLSFTEKRLLGLARAFIMNAEVTVLQKPFGNLDSFVADQVRRLLVEHRDNRGIGMPPEKLHCRRPRTVFFSVEQETECEAADVVWSLAPCRPEDLGLAPKDAAAAAEDSAALPWTVHQRTGHSPRVSPRSSYQRGGARGTWTSGSSGG